MKFPRNKKRLMLHRQRYKHLLKDYHMSMVESGTEIEFLIRIIRLLTNKDQEKIFQAELAVYDEMVKEPNWDRDVLDFYLMQAGDDK